MSARTRVLAIDVGIKNLSYCHMTSNSADTKDMQILDWENVCVTDDKCNKIKMEALTEQVLQALMERFDDEFETDVVVIENQPMLKNGMMKTVSVIIYTFFNMLKVQYGNIKEVRFISATNKLKCKKVAALGKSIDTYKDRKRLSIEVVKQYLQEICPEKIAWFSGLSKADDYADCALFAIYTIEMTRFN